MIGDRTGAIHVGPNQVMDLNRDEIDLPFNVHVYPTGILGLAPNTNMENIDIYLNGTMANVVNLILHHEASLWLFKEGRTENLNAGFYNFHTVHVKTGGYLHMITDPVTEDGIQFNTVYTHIDGGGLVRGTHVYFISTNLTIDSGGVMNADELGYRVTDTDDGSTGNFGVINPGRRDVGAGAGHGGSGGRPEGKHSYLKIQ